MSEKIYRVYRVYEGRKKDVRFAADLETAKELARNLVLLESPPEWVEDGHYKWKLKDYGEMNEGLYITEHRLKGEL